MSNVYERIGEALASNGRITVVAALTAGEELVLSTSNLPCIGTMDLNGSTVNLYSVKSNTSTVTVKTEAPFGLGHKPAGARSWVQEGPNKFKVTYNRTIFNADASAYGAYKK